MKWKITPMLEGVRAHFWSDKGYSTKTCANANEAQSWINAMKAKV